MSKRKTAEPLPASPSEALTAPTAERQPGDEPTTAPQLYPDPFPIHTDRKAGIKLLTSRRYFDKALGQYAFRQVQIKFDEKPPQPILGKIGEAGFTWDRTQRAWTRPVPEDGAMQSRIDAERVFKELATMLREAKGLGEEQGKVPF
jgi:hypothetical protein